MAVAVPASFFGVKYDASRYPGNTKGGIRHGANCQSFAYAFLKHFGRTIPDFRSSELWDDTVYTAKQKTLKPLDLLLFNKSRKAYGAHVAVYLGSNKAIHLSKEVGYPTIWDLKDFKKRKKYTFFLGAKRVRK